MSDKLTLKDYNDYKIIDAFVRLCNDGINYQTPDYTTLTHLLPIKHIMWIYGATGIYDFKHPVTGEMYEEQWSRSESERIEACGKINDRIRKYNKWVQREKNKITDIDKKIHFKYYPVSLYEENQVGAWMHMPRITRHDNRKRRDNQLINSNTFDNRHIYYKLLGKNEELGLMQFNKMIWDYICLAVDGKELHKDSTLYYPKLEFEDYWMRMGIDIDDGQIENLINSKDPSKSNAEHRMYSFINAFSSDQPWIENDLYNWGTQGKNRRKSYPKDWIVGINIDKNEIRFEHTIIKDYKAKGDLSEFGFRNYRGVPNSLIQLLYRYGHFQKIAKDNINAEDLWMTCVVDDKQIPYIKKLQRMLKKHMTEVLWLDDRKPMFTKHSVTTTQRSTKGKKESHKVGEYYTCEFDIQIDSDDDDTMRGVGMWKDQYENPRPDPMDDYESLDDEY